MLHSIKIILCSNVSSSHKRTHFHLEEWSITTRALLTNPLLNVFRDIDLMRCVKLFLEMNDKIINVLSNDLLTLLHWMFALL